MTAGPAGNPIKLNLAEKTLARKLVSLPDPGGGGACPRLFESMDENPQKPSEELARAGSGRRAAGPVSLPSGSLASVCFSATLNALPSRTADCCVPEMPTPARPGSPPPPSRSAPASPSALVLSGPSPRPPPPLRGPGALCGRRRGRIGELQSEVEAAADGIRAGPRQSAGLLSPRVLPRLSQ